MKIKKSIEVPVFKKILFSIFDPSLKYKANILKNVMNINFFLKYQSQKYLIYHVHYLTKL